MRLRSKRFIAVFLTLALLISLTLPVRAQTITDISGHWAEDQFKKWINYGIIAGYGDGTVRPNKEITRAEFVSLLSRICRFKKSPDNPFLDVSVTAWYGEDVLSAAAAGVISGDGKGYFSPEEPISRQQAAVALTKAFCLVAENENVLGSFKDAEKVAPWSKAALSALVENGYMVGKAGNLLAPEDNLTRAEFVVLMDRIAGTLINKEGIYSNDLEGNLTVNTENVVLENMVINGDLFLLEGIGEGTVVLDNVTVEGRTIVKGGGEDSIVIENSSLKGVLYITKADGRVRIVASGNTVISHAKLQSGAILKEESIDGEGFKSIDITDLLESDQEIVLEGYFETVKIEIPDVTLKIMGGAVEDLKISEIASDSKIIISKGVIVASFTAEAPADVTGQGTIKTAKINSNGVSIEKRPESTEIAPGVETVIGGITIIGTPQSGGGSKGGSTPAAPSAPENIKVSLTAHDKAVLYWEKVNNADGYNVYRCDDDSGAYHKVNTSVITENKFTDTGLLPDTTYFYKVSAVAGSSESGKSGEKSVTTPQKAATGEWKLVWSDEFNGIPGTGVDTDKWVYEVAGHGFGNQELQYTTDRTDNVYIEGDPDNPDNGFLVIQALKEKYQGKDYTSGRINTNGKFDFTYGRVEMRAKLPFGKGIGSAFWMLGSNYGDVGWPQCGEIDIMEYVAHYPDKIFGTIHGPGYSAGESIGAWHQHPEGFTDEFHTYAVEWEPGVIRWYFDDVMYVERSPVDLFGKEWTYDHEFFIILSLGVGGVWPGDPDETTVFPQKYIIDYVRVYQREGGIYPEYVRENLVQIRNAGNNKYVCADRYKDDYLYADRDGAALWETFKLVELKDNNVALLSLNSYKYVTVEPGTSNLVPLKESIGDSEIFELIENADGTLSLKSKTNGKFVTVEASGILRASAGEKGDSEKFVFIPYSAPGTPQGLKVDAVTNNTATLSWQSVDNATGYNLYRSEAEEGPYMKVNTGVITGTVYTDKGLDPGKTYYYKVAAINNVGQSFMSGPLYVEIPTGPTAPPAPQNLSMISSSEKSVLLKWDSVSEATGYNIYRYDSSNGNYEKINAEVITSVYYEDTGLESASAYYYKVTAVNDMGESAKSGTVFATTTGYGVAGGKQYSYIITVANSKIVETHDNDQWVPLRATANEASSDSQLFEIIYRADGDVGIASKQLNTLVCCDSWSVSDYQLIPRTDYGTNPGGWEQFTIVPQGDGTVAIRAGNGGKYVRIDPVTGVLKADRSTTVGIYEKFIIVTPGAPEKPEKLTVRDRLDTSLELSWQAPKNCVFTGYNIYRAVSDGEYVKINDDPVTALSFTDTGLTPDTLYNYKIVAVNIRGESEAAEISVSTLAGPIPEKPEEIDFTVNPDGSVTLNWKPDQNALGYNVYRASGRFGSYQKVNNEIIEATNYIISDTDAYKFYYKITAENEYGESRFSDPVSRDIQLFGPNVYIFDPSDDASEVQKIADNVYEEMKSADTAQFASGRYALLFKPGTYTTDVKVGYYTHVAGLGKLPTDTVIQKLTSEAALPDNNSTCNFWRAAENLTVNSNTQWAVSQAVSLRRVKINGDLTLHQAGGWASGGFLADSHITGTTGSGSQQQWFSRNSYWNRWDGGVWNMVFVGIADGKAPAETWPERPFTTIEETPVIKEKPFLYIDDGDYYVFAPDLRINSKGLSWNESDMGPGRSIPIEDFYIAHSDTDTADTINIALESGKHLLLTPGIYDLDKPIEVNNENTVVLGLGLATLTATNGNACMKIADVDGVMIAGVLFDAGEEKSEVLLEVGPQGSDADHSDNPTVLSDLYFRVGGRNEYTGKADVCIIINSNNVIGDNFWVWRADHGYNIKWDTNVTKNGIIVNGNDVTMYALMVEHFHEYQTLWNGNGGRTYFYQSEIPYDVPNQESWMSHDGKKNGYASYKVADHVTSHEAWGLGVYSYHRDATVDLHSAIEVPDHNGVKIYHACSVMLAGNPGISHVVNNEGGAVTYAGQRQEVIYYCNNEGKVAAPVLTPIPGTYILPQQVSITCRTDGAVIRYTTDNSDPTEDSPVYSEPITVDQYTVIKVRAFKEGLDPSDIVTAVYNIDDRAHDKNLVVNGTFDQGNWVDEGWGNYSIEGWSFWSGEGADGTPSIENGMAKIRHSVSDGANNWNTQLKQQGIMLEPGQTYILCFDVQCSTTRTIDVCVENASDTAIKYLQYQTVTIGPEFKTYSFEFKSGNEPANAQIAMMLGGSGKGSHSIYIDNVYLWQKDMTAPGQVKIPEFNISSGTYLVPQEIEIICATDNADIYYTLDGTEPSPENGIHYEGPFVVSADTVIKAIAVKAGMEDSLIASITLRFTDNFALRKPAIASSGTAALAFDGDMTSRWESDHSDPQWIMVDLGSIVDISGVKIVWEGAAGKVYDIVVSSHEEAWGNSGHESWTFVHRVTDGKGGHTLEEFFRQVSGRYLMVYGIERATGYGYSIWEFEVYANKVSTPVIIIEPDDVNAAEKLVTITSDTDGAEIWYTTDGTEPSPADGIKYTGPFTVTCTTTIKAMAYKPGMNNSNVASVLVQFNDNVAKGKTATASSGDAYAAIDGNSGSRWESEHSDPQWIIVDLGADYSIRKIRIVWETACAKDYTIDISEDGDNWTTIITKTDMPSPHTMDETLKEQVTARYVRMYGTKRATGWGYSIFEFEIYGTLADSPSPLSPTALAVTVTSSDAITLSWDDVKGADGYNVYQSVSPDGIFTKINEGGLITETSFTVTGLEPDTDYYYRVTAVKDRKESEYSETVHGRTLLE